MNLIQGFTNQSQQQMNIPLTGGTRAVLTLSFKAQQQGWFFDLTWNGNVVAKGQRLVLSPNVLRQYINQAPLGFTVLGNNDVEPTTVDSLSDGSTQIYLLQGDDLGAVETAAFGAPPGPVQAIATGPGGSPAVIPPSSWGPARGDLSQNYPDPWAVAFHTSDGQQLSYGEVPDGSFLKRVGSSIVGSVPPGGGDVVGPAGAVDGHLAVFDGSTGKIIKDGGVVPSGGSATLFANMTAFRAAAAPAVGTQCLLAGFGSIGDGGGGYFLFVASTSVTDDGGTHIVPGGTAPVVNAAGVITSPGTTATVGYWNRVDAMNAFNGGEGHKDVRWFGALADNSTDNTPAFRLALASLPFSSGTVYIPAGQWRMTTKWVVDLAIHGGTVTIKGDGPGGTILLYGMTASDTCLIEIKNGFGFGSFQDIQIAWAGYAGIFSNPKVLWIHDTTSFNVVNVLMSGLIAAGSGGGVLYCGDTSNTNLTLLGVSSVNGFGTQLFWNHGSGIINSCNFTEGDRGPGSPWVTGTNYSVGTYVTNANVVYMSRNVQSPSTTAPGSDLSNWEVVTDVNLPCHWVSAANTYMMRNTFFSGGGPWASFRGSTVTATGANFTVDTIANHSFIVGDYIALQGASQAGLNKYWKVSGVTAHTFTVTVSNSFASDTCVSSSLWSCMYVHGITESDMVGCFFNTGGSPGSGSVGVFMDAFSTGTDNIGEFCLSDCICDYGFTAFFVHGIANADPGSSAHRIMFTNCRPNGGPRDGFGSMRLEGCSEISAVNCHFFPGPAISTDTTYTYVVSDGGQSFLTGPVTITGGLATNKDSSALFPSATIWAFLFDGANVCDTSAQNVSCDHAATGGIASFINGATAANNITVMTSISKGSANAGRIQLIDSSGTHLL